MSQTQIAIVTAAAHRAHQESMSSLSYNAWREKELSSGRYWGAAEELEEVAQ